MATERSSLPNLQFPLTRFIVALMKRNHEQRMAADPQKAADGYGLPLAVTTYWIEEARRSHEVWPLKTRRQ
jgi:hypothetical protein